MKIITNKLRNPISNHGYLLYIYINESVTNLSICETSHPNKWFIPVRSLFNHIPKLIGMRAAFPHSEEEVGNETLSTARPSNSIARATERNTQNKSLIDISVRLLGIDRQTALIRCNRNFVTLSNHVLHMFCELVLGKLKTFLNVSFN